MIQHSCLHIGEHQKCSKESAAVCVRLRSTLLSLGVVKLGIEFLCRRGLRSVLRS